ncbi:hypothetical protein GGX14DRAFT_431798 [Mycena pura]|uniref:Uncharacterized protein n=1 Tax=Mycena pura TaxID=153505 RepID=A0AAD6YIZ3_9AGAR|nr:hypothetical protein GGX14DRAFT_431798 [Mycena pura]
MSVPSAAYAHGPMLIGVMLNVLLLGVVVMQVHIYFKTYTHFDPRRLKSLVAFVFIANVLNTGFAVADLYLALINHFGDFQYLKMSTCPAHSLQGAVAGAVQMFFAWRVRVLTGKRMLGVITGLLALGQFNFDHFTVRA